MEIPITMLRKSSKSINIDLNIHIIIIDNTNRKQKTR